MWNKILKFFNLYKKDEQVYDLLHKEFSNVFINEMLQDGLDEITALKYWNFFKEYMYFRNRNVSSYVSISLVDEYMKRMNINIRDKNFPDDYEVCESIYKDYRLGSGPIS